MLMLLITIQDISHQVTKVRQSRLLIAVEEHLTDLKVTHDQKLQNGQAIVSLLILWILKLSICTAHGQDHLEQTGVHRLLQTNILLEVLLQLKEALEPLHSL